MFSKSRTPNRNSLVPCYSAKPEWKKAIQLRAASPECTPRSWGEIRTQTRTNTNPYGTKAGAAGWSGGVSIRATDKHSEKELVFCISLLS